MTEPTYTLVQYCPCGHTGNVKTTDARIARQLANKNLVSAPVLHSNDCPECQEDDRLQEAMYDEGY